MTFAGADPFHPCPRMVLALIPVLWSDGRGAEVMGPMVLPVIGGMMADFVSLFSVPVFFAWFWEWRLRRTSRRQETPGAEIAP